MHSRIKVSGKVTFTASRPNTHAAAEPAVMPELHTHENPVDLSTGNDEPTSSSHRAIPSLIRNSSSSSDVVILSRRVNPLEFLAVQDKLAGQRGERNRRTVRRLNRSSNPRTQSLNNSR